MTESNVIITDYIYNPQPRPSFSNGPLKRLMDRECGQNRQLYQELRNEILKNVQFFNSLTMNKTDEYQPYIDNGFLPLLDGIMIYTILGQRNPAYYFEVGSGNSTKYAAKAIRDLHLRTRIISVDPAPRAFVNHLCTANFRCSFENFDLEFLKLLSPNDVVVVDCSHRAFSNSDVTVFFTEALPMLPRGLIYALHDIWLPVEVYWERFYNEQYMLATWLLAGADGDQIYFPTHYLQKYTDIMRELSITISNGEKVSLDCGGSLFWMRRNGGRQ